MVRLFLMAITAFLSVYSYALPSTFLVQDGSVARCESVDDIGRRAFKVVLNEVSPSKIELIVDTFICTKISDGTVGLQDLPLSTPQVSQQGGKTYSYEIPQAFLVFTNTDVSKELLRLNIQTGAKSQRIIVEKAALDEKVVDLTIVGLGVFKIDNEISDQGMMFGGHYRIKY